MGLNFVNVDTGLGLTVPKKALSLLIATLLFSTTQAAHADISGYVFRDYNANGQRDESATFKEPYMGGLRLPLIPDLVQRKRRLAPKVRVRIVLQV